MATPNGYLIRHLAIDDAPAMANILAAAELAEPADEHFSEEDLAEELRSPGMDLARHSIGVCDGAQLVAFGIIQSPTVTDAWRAFLFGGVHPGHRRRGIGGHVLDALVTMARRARDAAGTERPGELKFEVEGARHSAAALAGSRGFDSWRWFSRMQRDLSRPPDPPEDLDGVRIRGYRGSDSENVRAAYNASFAGQWGFVPSDPDRWRAGTADSSSFRPDQSLLAIAADGSLAGFVLVEEYDAETEQRGHRTGYIDVLGTVPAARRRGVASALLAHCLRRLAEDGFAVAELGTDSGSPAGAGTLYARAGFTTTARGSVVGLRF